MPRVEALCTRPSLEHAPGQVAGATVPGDWEAERGRAAGSGLEWGEGPCQSFFILNVMHYRLSMKIPVPYFFN